jgi:hypothetical protein
MKRLAAFLLLVATGVVAAGDAKTSHQAIAPYVDDLTFAVVRLDVPRIKIEEALRRFEQLAGDKVPAEKINVNAIAKFTQAGGKDVFLLWNMADGVTEPLVVVPMPAGTDRQAMLELMKLAPNTETEEKGGVILMGSPNAMEAARKREAKAIPELAKALAAVDKFAAYGVLLPPRPFLRAQEELAPNLPKELGGGPITDLTRGFQWGAAGIDLAPKMDIRIVVQARDAGAADDLQKLSERALATLTARVENDVPALRTLVPMLKPKVEGDRLVLAVDDKALQAVLTPTIVQTRLAASRAQSMNNLKQMGLALHNYHDTYKAFPPQANLSKQKKPLLSWRVHILPFLDQDNLYKQFKLNEPWDSEHNKKLIPQMPEVYRSPLAKKVAAGKTVYLAPAGPQMIFGGPKTMSLFKITDGTSNTIMLVEANDDHAVVWTKPDDYKPDRQDPLTPLLRKDAKGFHIALADASVGSIAREVTPEVFWGMLTPNGGEVFEIPWTKNR